MKTRDIIQTILSLYVGRCGHLWVGATGGYYACPLCGDHGDHHLTSQQPIPVQIEDWGVVWGLLGRLQQSNARDLLPETPPSAPQP